METYIPVSDDITAFLYKFHTRYYKDDYSNLACKVFEFSGNLAIYRRDFDCFITDELVAKHDVTSCDVYRLQFGTGADRLDICVYPKIVETHTISQELPIKFMKTQYEPLINQIKFETQIGYIKVFETENILYIRYDYLGEDFMLLALDRDHNYQGICLFIARHGRSK